MKVLLGRKYNIIIPINTIGIGLKLPHPHNIVISAKNGTNFVIQFNCSLVAGGHVGDVPEVGDNVCIGTSSVILGDIYIADGISVGANSTVNKSFYEKNICIAGTPSKKISNNGSNTWGINNKRDEKLLKDN